MIALTPEDRRRLELAGLLKPAAPTASKHQPTGRFLKDLRVRAGLCPRCGKPADGKRYCAEHREVYRLASMRRREGERG